MSRDCSCTLSKGQSTGAWLIYQKSFLPCCSNFLFLTFIFAVLSLVKLSFLKTTNNIKSVVVLPLAVSVNSGYSLLHLSESKWQTAGSTATTAGLTATPFQPILQQQMIYIMISQPYDHIQGTNQQCSWPSLPIKQKTKWKQCNKVNYVLQMSLVLPMSHIAQLTDQDTISFKHNNSLWGRDNLVVS